MSNLLNGAWNFFELSKRFFDIFVNSTPMNVTVPQKDENGVIHNYTTPNRAMMKKGFWDNVGGALGQFNKVIHVDSVNGDDGNLGTSTSPFKTIQQAISVVPFGGTAYIYIMNDIEVTGYKDIGNRRIVFRSTLDNENAKIIFNIDQTTSKLNLGVNSIVFQCDFEIKNSVDSYRRNAFHKRGGILVLTNNYARSANAGSTQKIKIKLNNNTKISHIALSNLSLDYVDLEIGDNCSISSIGYQSNFALNIGKATLNGNLITQDDYTSLIDGIIRDADSGNPINVSSNINFSS